MIEITIYNWIKNRLDAPVYFERPDRMPKRFVLMEKVGGSRRNHINSAAFAFQSYAESMYEAATLNERVKEAVDSIIESPVIGGLSFNGDYNFTDTEEGIPRYQAVYDFRF